MNWRHIFDARNMYPLNFPDCAEVAKTAGYKFMAFNGTIYFHAKIWQNKSAQNPDGKYLEKWVETPLKVGKNGEIE